LQHPGFVKQDGTDHCDPANPLTQAFSAGTRQ
jgi:hypothetical protein